MRWERMYSPKEVQISVLWCLYFAEMRIDLIAGYAIISSWQHFGNRKSVSQNKVCK